MSSPTMIRVNYDELDTICRQVDQRQQQLQQHLHRLAQMVDTLKNGGFVGRGAASFYAEMDTQVLESHKRLVDAIQEFQATLQVIIILFEDAEHDACSYVEFDALVLSEVTSWFGDNYALLADQLGNLIAIGDDVISLENIKLLFKLLNIDMPPGLEKTLGDVAKPLGKMIPIVDGILTYVTNYEDEPFLIRGGGVAAIDTVYGLALDLTGVGAVVQLVNSGHQFLGALDVGLTSFVADHMSISDTMRQNLQETLGRRSDVLQKTDLDNIRYDVARLSYSGIYATQMQAPIELMMRTVPMSESMFMNLGLHPSQNNLMNDGGKLLGTVGNFGLGIVEYPDSYLDTSVTKGVAAVSHLVNESPMPQGVKSFVDGLGNAVIDYAQNSFLGIPNPFDLFN